MLWEDLIGSAEERIGREALALGEGGKDLLAGSDNLVEDGDICCTFCQSATAQSGDRHWSRLLLTVIAVVRFWSAAYRCRGWATIVASCIPIPVGEGCAVAFAVHGEGGGLELDVASRAEQDLDLAEGGLGRLSVIWRTRLCCCRRRASSIMGGWNG
jgi:hypothetical protein